MNRKQRQAVYIGLIALVAVTLLPPWKVSYFSVGPLRPKGHAPIFAPPHDYFVQQVAIDWDRLALYWIVIALLTTIATLSFRSGRRSGKPNAEHANQPQNKSDSET